MCAWDGWTSLSRTVSRGAFAVDARLVLEEIHFPKNQENLEQARRRFVYQELFVMQLALAMRCEQLIKGDAAEALAVSAKIDARIRRLFPFELTSGQNQVIDEIVADMGRTQPMNRLLEGDVGSGKTVIAVYAMLLAVAHGAQAALMAPTELLVRQHARTLERLLAQSQVRLGVLTGSVTGKQREQLLAEVAGGEVKILIGTQAMIETEVKFDRLGLVVIDEQHKFGVRDRAAFKQAGQPHCLVMTATPIPARLPCRYMEIWISRHCASGQQVGKACIPICHPETNGRDGGSFFARSCVKEDRGMSLRRSSEERMPKRRAWSKVSRRWPMASSRHFGWD